MAVLRRHPKIHWPPVWSGSSGPDTEIPVGEQGVLKVVQRVTADPTAVARLLLRVEHDGGEFWSFLQCDDAVFLSRLHLKLKQCIGKPMREIGSLDIES